MAGGLAAWLCRAELYDVNQSEQVALGLHSGNHGIMRKRNFILVYNIWISKHVHGISVDMHVLAENQFIGDYPHVKEY